MAEDDATTMNNATEEAAAGPPAPPAEAEKRDDLETVAFLDSEFRTEGSSGNEEAMMEAEEDTGDDNDVEDDNAMNVTCFDDDDDSKLDINSVLSGNNNDIDDDDDDVTIQEGGVFGKNLGAIFDDAKEMDRRLKNPPSAASAAAAPASKLASNSSSLPSRPPLAPTRAAASVSALKSNTKDVATNTAGAEDDKRLGVFLRVRPPVCNANNGKSKQGNEGSINTIEVISDASAPLSTTIRTYPPLNSNAAKVVRGGAGRHAASDSSLKNALGSSKSLYGDSPSCSNDSGVDPHAEVRGVKEYSYSGVFGVNATQSDVYDNVAAPLVDGLFPQTSNSDELGESALLFTLGVTNAGKTHTVMGTGFETKADMKKMQKEGFAPNKDWGIIPRSLDHMLSRVNNLNEQASSAGQPQLQMYMSYLEIYNEQIYDLLPDKASTAPRRPCDGPPTLKLRESRRGRIFVRGLVRHAVSNVRQGLELAQTAKNNRHTASNNINAESSRSHSICQLEIAYAPPAGLATGGKKTGLPDATECVDSEYETDDESVCSKSSIGSNRMNTRQQQPLRKKSAIIWIVDLAGSERSKRTCSHTRHQKEAALINASLMNLMRCLREMLNHQPKKKRGGGGGGVVPFRESKLTHMFMNHLTGPSASRTTMIVNVNPAADDYDETQHVLSYAATARNVTISAVDYNRKRRMFAKESSSNKVTKTSPSKKKGLIANIVKKLSPKRKRTIESSSNPKVKRLRSNNSSTAALNNSISKKFAPRAAGGGGSAARKPPPRLASTRALKSSVQTGNNEELEQLREENFSLQVTVDDLRKQLADSEAEVRNEVVDMMGEQLEERKEWYENRITQLQQQIAALQSSKQAQFEYQNNEAELLNECEEEMKRMREDHNAEVEDLSATHLHLVKEHDVAMEKLAREYKEDLRTEKGKSERLEEEAGAMRHQSRELQVSHDSLLSKYNALLLAAQEESAQNSQSKETYDTTAAAAPHHEKENPAAASATKLSDLQQQSPSSFRKLPRKRVSDVASTATNCVDIVVSPKKKRAGGWFGRSPGAKVDTGGEKKMSPVKQPSTNTRSPTRSPLGKINKN